MNGFDRFLKFNFFKANFLFQWAKQVLTIEQNVSAKERLKQQKKYANTLSTGEKAFIVRWKMTVNFRKDKANLNNFFLFIQNAEREEMKNYKSFFQLKITDIENCSTVKDI